MSKRNSSRDQSGGAKNRWQSQTSIVALVVSIAALLFTYLQLRESSQQTDVATQALTASVRPLVVGIPPRSFAEQEAIFDGVPIEGGLEEPDTASTDGERIRQCLDGTDPCVVPFYRSQEPNGVAQSVPLRNVGPGPAVIVSIQLLDLKNERHDALQPAPVIPSGGVQRFDFNARSGLSFVAVEAKYSDVAGLETRTSCVYMQDGDVSRVTAERCDLK